MGSGSHEITRRVPVSSSRQLLAELHAKIRAETLGSDAMLHQIVEAARILTCAHGAAIAMRQDGSVLCMARAGSTAPALGSELQVDSGISGQCLRTGTPLCCDDTSTDTRVDREVCRRLGLRSLAVAPLGKWPAVTGVLEVFSATPHAFSDAEVKLLAELANLLEVTPRASTTPGFVKVSQNAGLKLASATGTWSNRRLILTAVVLVFVIYLGLVASVMPPEVWVFLTDIMHGEFRGGEARPNAPGAGLLPRSTLGASSAAEEPSTLPANPLRPSPVQPRNTRANLPNGSLMASTTEKTRPSGPAIPREPQREAFSVANAPATAANLKSPMPTKTTVDGVATAPSLDVVSADNDALPNGVFAPVTSSPVPATLKQSTGVSGGTIERMVKPIYPPAALRLKRAGRVVLQAVITKEGSVRDLKVIDGDLLLARAAMDAVAQWRYQPYRLNGQPTPRTMEITIFFKLPN